MERGEALIYGGRISVGDLLGEPDLLQKRGDGYLAGDIKSGAGEEGASDEDEGKPKRHYGYLIVESPIQERSLRLPIVHRDDFLLAASVFDEPKLADLVRDEELLMTYAPRKVLPKGLAGDSSHALHYVITPYGTLEDYYSNDMHRVNPTPEKLLGPLVYEGEIKVGLNFEPEF